MNEERIRKAIANAEALAWGSETSRVLVAAAGAYADLLANGERVKWCEEHNEHTHGKQRGPRDGGFITPAWAYDAEGYCVCCGNGNWRFHTPDCHLRDALDALREFGAR